VYQIWNITMLNQVLWILDNETDFKTFERLCVDLLFRNGFHDIIPFGGIHDNGRDAEVRGQGGHDEAGRITFFQFSLQKDWKKKLRSELRKVAAAGHQISRFVLVTSQEVHGRDIDRLKEQVKNEFEWDLAIYSREWLRLQLEEVHPDLAAKHLGIEFPQSLHIEWKGFKFQSPDVGDPKNAWNLFIKEDYERAAAELRHYLKQHPGVSKGWELLAWCLYLTFRYEDALAAINVALDLSPQSLQTISIRACILAESGIERNDYQRIKEANEIFRELLDSRDDGLIHYNYANTLGSLGRFEEAIHHYKIATEREPSDAQIWKNLASAYHEIGRHDLEMECLDKAIDLDPNLTQALVSKGTSMLMDFDRPQDCIELIERALSVNRDFVVRWPHIWYWMAEAHKRLKEYDKSLAWIQQGLRHHPGQKFLKDQEFDVFCDLHSDAPERVAESLKYFLSVVSEQPLHYAARVQAVSILEQQGRVDEAWLLLEGAFDALDTQIHGLLRSTGASIQECCTALNYLPDYINFRELYPSTDYAWEGAPLVDQDFFDFITAAGAIAFGVSKSSLIKSKSKEAWPSPSELKDTFMNLLERIMLYVSLSAKLLAKGLSRDMGVEIVSERVAQIIMFTPRVVGEEWIRQFGSLCGRVGIPERAQEEIIEAFSDRNIVKEMIEPTINRLNAVAKIFPEEEGQTAD
jgi:tetratricopeptide (TPR) repeat protein